MGLPTHWQEALDPMDLAGNRTPGPQSVSKLTPAQQAMFDEMFAGLAGKDYTSVTKEYNKTPEEQQYLDFLKGYSSKYGSDWARSTAAEVSNSINPEATKKYFADVVRPDWEKNTKPAIYEAYSGYSGWSTTRANAIQRSSDEIGRQEATALFDVEKQRQGSYATILGQLLGQQPGQELATKGAAADLAHKFATPEANPYYLAAQNLLGVSTFDTVIPEKGMFQGVFS